MLLTVYSSLSYGVVSYYGYRFGSWECIWFMVLMVLSMMNNYYITDEYTRTPLNSDISYLYTRVSQIAVITTMYDALILNKIVTRYLLIYLVSLIYVIFVSSQPVIYGHLGELRQCSVHIYGSIGVINLLFHKQLINY